jgi:ATP-dependent helicase HrpB
VEALARWRAREPVNADRNVLQRVDRLARQWVPFFPKGQASHSDSQWTGRLLALAYPERVARQLGQHQTAFRLSNGRRAALAQGDDLVMEPWLAIADLDAGLQEGKIYLAAPVNPAELVELHTTLEVLEWDAKTGQLNAAVEQRVGNLAFDRKPLREISPEQVAQVLVEAIRANPAYLNWDDAVQQLQARVLSLRLWRPAEAWPDYSQQALVDRMEEWLTPYLAQARRAEDLKRLNLAEILSAALGWEASQQLEALAPTHLVAPTGTRIRLEYALDGAPPVMAVRLQEMFGCFETPTVNAGRQRVMVHLLSPAYRPVQVTQDLAGFWTGSYADVRKDLRGRYPKHHWPEDPTTAEPTRGVKRK